MSRSSMPLHPINEKTEKICVMTHSFFSNVIRIVCTDETPEECAKKLSAKTPGDYNVAYAIPCEGSLKVKESVQLMLTPIECVKEFYDATPEEALKLIKRETMKIASFDLH